MDIEPVDDQYFTYHGRLASFQKSKKRGSTAKGSKALNWPHKNIAPEDVRFVLRNLIGTAPNC